MHITKATINDLKAATELFDLYRVYFRQPSDQAGASNYLKERIVNEQSVIYVAFDEDIAVGIAQLYPSFSSIKMRRTWVLNDLFVKESYRGQGIGEKLLRSVISFAKETNAKGILLETEDDNFGAQKLYKRIGFERETNYYYFYTI
ncbi:GNAT family N-acetyltransferase [Bacillus solimangrovi]|uniref:GNAT family N-acetyltransferase n=1 Tax=Bacillus solimangrovi TaxID=1305675 RepID=A0A1E5LF69_9BACI|nr:GNAT family N-acetyltransferase [Bacillus solimangrovi]OEH92713.1 GNAT family N-acetyltransferase [Bacillus solimangrovi]